MKKFIAPLQAFAALGICLGMAWMIFVVAGFNPSPPTALDIQARKTADLSYTNMNSTAVALARDMFVDFMPTPGPVVMPVTGGRTPTPALMAAVTLRPVSGFVQTPTSFPLFSFLVQPTATRKSDEIEPTITPYRAPTQAPPTATRTLTPIPPSSTPVTPTLTQIPSSTPIPPTKEPTTTNTSEPTSIPTNPPPTSTSIPPTDPPPPTNPPPTQPPPPTNPPPTEPPPPTNPPPTQPPATP